MRAESIGGSNSGTRARASAGGLEAEICKVRTPLWLSRVLLPCSHDAYTMPPQKKLSFLQRKTTCCGNHDTRPEPVASSLLGYHASPCNLDADTARPYLLTTFAHSDQTQRRSTQPLSQKGHMNTPATEGACLWKRHRREMTPASTSEDVVNLHCRSPKKERT